jgi:hypothetical protein
MRLFAIVATLGWSLIATAHPHSARECREGGDFIRNAALARDAGYTREFFVGRLEEDFVMIRAVPPDLRWFVRDPSDEDFLRSEVEAVFGTPTSSDQHRAGFLQRCIRRAERETSQDT